MKSFISVCASLLCFAGLARGQATCGSVETISGKNMAVYLRIEASMVYITLTGTEGEMFAAGFDGTAMSGTYAIIVAGSEIFEYNLANHQPGTEADVQSLTIESDATSGGIRTVLLSRPLNTDDIDLTYSAGQSLTIIFARNDANTFTAHGDNSEETDFGSTSITFADVAEDDASCGLAIPEDVSSTTEEPEEPEEEPSTTEESTYTCGTVVTRADDNMAVYLKIDEDNSMVYITMTGPDSQWFGAGFGSSTMTGTYAIIVDDSGVFEQSLENHAKGSKLTPTQVTTESDESSGGIRTVMLSRALAGTDSDYYTFVTSGDIDIIYGTSSATSFAQHTAKGATTLSLTSGLTADSEQCGPEEETATTVADEDTTEAPAEEDPATSIVADVDGYVCGTVVTRADDDMKVYVRIDEDNEMVYITLTGPDDQWFGAGFGASTMDGTYTIIVDDSGISERELGDHVAGSVLTASLTTLSDESSGGVRTVLLARELTGTDDSYYTFVTSGSISIIYGTTSTSASFTGHDSRGATTLDLAGGYAEDATECGAEIPLSNYVCGTVDTSSADDMSVSVRINIETSMVYLTMTGPDDQWFGAGFGAAVMDGTYTIIVDDSGVSERTLGDHVAGTELTASVTTLSDESTGGVRTVLVSRELTGDDASYYTFSTDELTVDVIYGTTADAASFTAHTTRGATTVTLAGGYAADATECGESVPDDDENSTSDAPVEPQEDAASMSKVLFAAACVVVALMANN